MWMSVTGFYELVWAGMRRNREHCWCVVSACVHLLQPLTRSAAAVARPEGAPVRACQADTLHVRYKTIAIVQLID